MDMDFENRENIAGCSSSVFGNTFDNLPLSDLLSPTSSANNDADNEENPTINHFQETFKQLEALARILACSKCEKLPKGKIWNLGCCLVKYCEPCAKELAGRACVACGVSGYPKDVKPDLFSSSILSEIPSVYMTIMQLEEGFDQDEEVKDVGESDRDSFEKFEDNPEIKKTCDKKGVEVEPLVSDSYEFPDEDNHILLIQCTPKANSGTPTAISQEFPDVLEETPQNKDRRRSFTYGMAKNRKSDVIPARALSFPSQEPTDTTTCKAKETLISKKTPSPEKNQSDEELFRSPSCREKGGSPVEIPSLTPYHAESKGNRLQRSKTKGKGKVLKNAGGRSSDERGPPTLTPHKINGPEKEEGGIKGKEENAISMRSTRRKSVSSAPGGGSNTVNVKRKSVRGQKVNVEKPEKADSNSSAKKLSVDSGSRTKKSKATPLISSSDRTRGISSTSISSTSSGHGCSVPPRPATPIEKRNAKGETALHVACRGGQLEKVQQLVEAGADVNAKDYAGWTPLYEVINGKGEITTKNEILRILCESGGDGNSIGGMDAETPLHAAVQRGADSLVKILLEFGASPNIRSSSGRLPKDLASKSHNVIVKLLEEKMVHVTVAVPSCSPLDSANMNNSTFLGTTSMVEEDPAVMKVMLEKAIVYFNYKVDPVIVQACKDKLALKVSDTLTRQVTHMIHKFTDDKERKHSRVPITMEYLHGLANCMWQVSSDWITASLKNGTCVIPTGYEILGHYNDSSVDFVEGNEEMEMPVPGVARMNREFGNPGLLDGFSFYLYKTCSYVSSTFKLDKRQLVEIIIGAGGSITNREPNPDSIDPLAAPYRYHVFNNTRGGESCSSDGSNNARKFELLTHMILYDDNSPPPPTKRHNMEHVKSLKIDWLVNSLTNFRLEDPEKYL